MDNTGRHIVLRDSTLREGLDVPHVTFSMEQRLLVARQLDAAGISEIEIVAPGKVESDLSFARTLKDIQLDARSTGLLYASHPDLGNQIKATTAFLDWIDLLMPVSLRRKPHDPGIKITVLGEALKLASETTQDFGAGFPNATQSDPDFLLDIAARAVEQGAGRVTVYDTNGHADPFTVFDLVAHLSQHLDVPLFFHGHNDLGMATANSMAAVSAGAAGIDATVNGLGDRAGNCSLEQMALLLELKEFNTGIALELLKPLSQTVAKESGVGLSPLAPVVGDYIFSHQSPAHLEVPDLFEAYDPAMVGSQRKLIKVDQT